MPCRGPRRGSRAAGQAAAGLTVSARPENSDSAARLRPLASICTYFLVRAPVSAPTSLASTPDCVRPSVRVLACAPDELTVCAPIVFDAGARCLPGELASGVERGDGPGQRGGAGLLDPGAGADANAAVVEPAHVLHRLGPLRPAAHVDERRPNGLRRRIDLQRSFRTASGGPRFRAVVFDVYHMVQQSARSISARLRACAMKRRIAASVPARSPVASRSSNSPRVTATPSRACARARRAAAAERRQARRRTSSHGSTSSERSASASGSPCSARPDISKNSRSYGHIRSSASAPTSATSARPGSRRGPPGSTPGTHADGVPTRTRSPSAARCVSRSGS